jgi:hypothetical protein
VGFLSLTDSLRPCLVFGYSRGLFRILEFF